VAALRVDTATSFFCGRSDPQPGNEVKENEKEDGMPTVCVSVSSQGASTAIVAVGPAVAAENMGEMNPKGQDECSSRAKRRTSLRFNGAITPRKFCFQGASVTIVVCGGPFHLSSLDAFFGLCSSIGDFTIAHASMCGLPAESLQPWWLALDPPPPRPRSQGR
jgi:hypothetical protein